MIISILLLKPHCQGRVMGLAAVQTEDIRASFLFVGDLNGHHQEWLGSIANRHGVAAFDYATVSGCEQ